VNLVRGAIAGIAAGMVGAGLWAGVVYFTDYELGIVAWGIGALVGGAVWLGIEQRGNTTSGGIAAAIAVAAILLGKWGWITLVVDDIYKDDDNLVAMLADIVIEDRRAANERVIVPPMQNGTSTLQEGYPRDVWAEAAQRWNALSEADKAHFREAPSLLNGDLYLVYLADAIVEDRLGANETVAWPGTHDLATAWRAAHYPPDIWDAAIQMWEDYTPDEQAQYLAWLDDKERTRFAASMAAFGSEQFIGSFSHFDALWGLLAILTAFQLGARNEHGEPAA
jgi:hypothetical protein